MAPVARVVVVIPTYNEAENIGPLLERLLALRDDLSVLVVDDGSPDGTAEIAERAGAETGRVEVLRRPAKLGLGSAYRAGFRRALEDPATLFVVQMDADFSHPPEDVARMLPLLEGTSHDIVVGARYVRGGHVRDWPLHRKLLSRMANVYARVVLGLPRSDLTAGFKCFRRAALESIDLDAVRSEGYGFQIEMSWHAHHLGFRTVEMPIEFTDRRCGASKLDPRILLEAAPLVWKLRFRRPPLARVLPRHAAAHARG